MAEGLRSRAENARTLKLQELKALADELGLEGAERSQYIRTKYDSWEVLDHEREQCARQQAHERERLAQEHEMERERQRHELLMRDRDLERIRLESESRSLSPTSNHEPSNGQPQTIPFDCYDPSSETIEVFLERYEATARHFNLPEDKWCFRLAHLLEEKPTKFIQHFRHLSVTTTRH